MKQRDTKKKKQRAKGERKERKEKEKVMNRDSGKITSLKYNKDEINIRFI